MSEKLTGCPGCDLCRNRGAIGGRLCRCRDCEHDRLMHRQSLEIEARVRAIRGEEERRAVWLAELEAAERRAAREAAEYRHRAVMARRVVPSGGFLRLIENVHGSTIAAAEG